MSIVILKLIIMVANAKKTQKNGFQKKLGNKLPEQIKKAES